MRISIILHGKTEVLHEIYANGNPEIAEHNWHVSEHTAHITVHPK